MRTTDRQRREGFTLIELVMVVAILGLLATVVVTMFGSIQRQSAEKVSIANQEGLTRALNTYLTLNNGSGLNNLDALIDFGTALGTAGTFTGNATLNSAPVPGGVYRGVKAADAAGTAADATTAAKNVGLDDGIYGVASVYYLSSSNVTALKNGVGLSTVWYHSYISGRANTLQATNPDGTSVTAAPGFRVESTSAFQIPLEAGTAVLAVDPLKGASLYKAFGQDLKLASDATDSDAQSAASSSGWYLLLFGLGSNASVVGARNGGIDDAPRSEILPSSYYRQYFLVVRIPTSPNAFNAELAGVIDPAGQTIRSARFANDWRNGNQ